jgi:chromosome segregation ATPase
MQISELVQKIEGEMSAEWDKIFNEKEALKKKKADLTKKEAELEVKKLDLDKISKDIQPQLDEIALVKQKLISQDKLAEEKREIYQARSDAERFRRDAENSLNAAKQKLEEQTKRELALSKRESEYKEQIEKEVVKKFLSGSLVS